MLNGMSASVVLTPSGVVWMIEETRDVASLLEMTSELVMLLYSARLAAARCFLLRGFSGVTGMVWMLVLLSCDVCMMFDVLCCEWTEVRD